MRLDDLHSLELARPDDADVIAAGTAESMQPGQHGLVLAASPKYAKYIRYLLDHPHLEPDRRHYVVRSRGAVVGYLDLRRIDSAPHLNHIWISSSRRGTGIGSTALRTVLKYCAPDSMFDLNVVARNPAQRWYEALGMATDRVDRWYVRSVLPAAPFLPRSAHMVSASLSVYGIATVFQPANGDNVDLLEPDMIKISLSSNEKLGLANTADAIAATYPTFTRVAEHIRDFDAASTDPQGAQLVSVHMKARAADVVEALTT